ncbi:MAG: LysM peptidoglycan-binding domain-containing protein, partial [Halomonadaceae bacterium]|nr:LysM peptidoglycan-binding domain-containing protein [Halomonadaceae bacterium]
MRKVFFLSAIALAVAGCATQDYGTPQVRDLSASREQATVSHYVVEQGDTLYGIAWRHEMDYRDLARLNQIGPPYRIQPGQELRLNEGPRTTTVATQEQGTDSQVAVATGLGGQQAFQSSDDDWLLPDEQAIERNRRLSAQPLDTATQAPSDVALESADQVAATSSTAPESSPP